jgi:hypothetical protein
MRLYIAGIAHAKGDTARKRRKALQKTPTREMATAGWLNPLEIGRAILGAEIRTRASAKASAKAIAAAELRYTVSHSQYILIDPRY